MSYDKQVKDIIYLINLQYYEEYYECENIYIEEDNSIYVRKFTIEKIFRDKMTLWCHNDAKLYTWNYKSKLLLKQRCNRFAFEYEQINDNDVGEYLFQQSKVQSIMRHITVEIIHKLAYKTFLIDEDIPMLKALSLWSAKLSDEQDKFLNLESEKIKKYFEDKESMK